MVLFEKLAVETCFSTEKTVGIEFAYPGFPETVKQQI